MLLPRQTPAIARTAGRQPMSATMHPSGCDVLKCAVAIATCASQCAGGVGPCLTCLANIGAPGCLDCFT